MSNPDRFDYEEARLDILENGGDPDYLSEYMSPEKRDAFLRSSGLDPDNYREHSNRSSGGSSRSSSSSSSSPGFFDTLFGDEPSGSDESCFVTTACIRAKGLPDDCEELTVLRAFRDKWVRTRENGREEIQLYYDLAPGIVAKIDRLPDANEIWSAVYEEMIRPCVDMIHRNDGEGAYRLYKDYTFRLKRQTDRQ